MRSKEAHFAPAGPADADSAMRPESAQPRRVAFDLSNLLGWYSFRPHVTGMQRVITRIAAAAATDPAVEFVGRVSGAPRFSRLNKAAVSNLVQPSRQEIAAGYLRKRYWRQRLAQLVPAPIEALFRPASVALARGDALVNLGDFWNLGDTMRFYRQMRAESEIRLFQFVHDIIPLTHPEFVKPQVRARFQRRFRDVVALADGLLVSSNDVKMRLDRQIEQLSLAPHKIHVVPFGWDFARDDEANDQARVDSVLAKYGLSRGRYLLQVGTIEPRKNHLLVVRTLESLRRKLGRAPIAAVFVGWWGWKTGALERVLAESGNLDGSIRILSDVDDASLAALYRGCRVTLFPSVAEGWGLPIQESLLFGKPCLASDLNSLREVGGDLLEYFDPADAAAFEALLERWITDDALVEARERRIADFLAARDRLPTWSDAARAIVSIARSAA